MKWFYLKDGVESGPLEEGAFLLFAKRGIITPETMVWNETFPEWIPWAEARFSASASGPATGTAVAAMTPGGTTASAMTEVPGLPVAGFLCPDCGRNLPQDEMRRHGPEWMCADCRPKRQRTIRRAAGWKLAGGLGGILGILVVFFGGMPFLDGVKNYLSSYIREMLLMMIAPAGLAGAGFVELVCGCHVKDARPIWEGLAEWQRNLLRVVAALVGFVVFVAFIIAGALAYMAAK